MQKFNLYVKNIPLNATDAELQEHFIKYGPIKSCKIMRAQKPDPSSTELPPSLGFGFVSFTTTEGAAKARLESKNIPFQGKILYVAQFETREVREAHLAETQDKKDLEEHKRAVIEGSHNQQQTFIQHLNQSANGQTQGITWLQVLQIAMALKTINMNQLNRMHTVLGGESMQNQYYRPPRRHFQPRNYNNIGVPGMMQQQNTNYV